MAPPTWLPPLNSHEDYTIQVQAFQTPTPHNMEFAIPIPKFVIKLTVAVDFSCEGPTEDIILIPGLHLERSVAIHRNNSATIPGSLLQEVLTDDLVPFPLNHCSWKENCFRRNRIWPRWEPIDDEEQLLDRISWFLISLTRKPENKRRRIIPVLLEIRKAVTVPQEEFGSWVSWYQEQKRVDPNFEEEYEAAIARPRNEEELLVEAAEAARKSAGVWSVDDLESMVYYDSEKDGKACCCICLEEILNGTSVTRLRCLHVYHRDCVVRWLAESPVCPLCRFKLATDKED